jgi:hypothetical protein
MEAPMGPTPNCTTRIFFFTVPSLVFEETNTLKGSN